MRWKTKGSRSTKYGNRKTTVDGIEFDSRKEAARWLELRLLQRTGEISGLQRQVVFELVPKSRDPFGHYVPPVTYKADFTYFEKGKLVVEDVKSDATRKLPEYRIKKKLMWFFRKLWIKEV